MIDAMASVITLCGSISRLSSPLGRSMHEAGYRALDLPFAYVPFEVESAAAAMAAMRALAIRGFGVSHPFKQDVIAALDDLHPIARRIGAVNTVVNEGRRLVGHNTDWVGAVRALEEVTSLSAARVLLLGAGGAARAIAFGLRERAARTTIANRDEAKAARIAAEVDARATGLDEAYRAADYEIVINATTLGQADVSSDSPVPDAALRVGQIVMDIVYKPLSTRLLAAAHEKGATAVDGGRMLLHQAAAQFEIYTGRPAPLDAMNRALKLAPSPSGGNPKTT